MLKAAIQKLFQLLVMVVMVVAALYAFSVSFLGTNILAVEEFSRAIGILFEQPFLLGFLYFLLAIPLVAAGGYGILGGSRRMIKVFGAGLGIYCIPTLLAHSHFNWLLFVDKSLRMPLRLPLEEILAAMIIVMAGYLYLSYVLRLEEMKKELIAMGGDRNDVASYLGEHIAALLMGASVSITVVVIGAVDYISAMVASEIEQIPFTLWVVGIGGCVLVFVAIYVLMTTFRSTEA
ncbi:MAG: hypothetical protein ACP5FL_09320 [Thermoplasmatota archaeon]